MHNLLDILRCINKLIKITELAGASPRIFEWGDESSAVWPIYPQNTLKIGKTPDLGPFILESGGRPSPNFSLRGRPPVPAPAFDTHAMMASKAEGTGGGASPQ